MEIESLKAEAQLLEKKVWQPTQKVEQAKSALEIFDMKKNASALIQLNQLDKIELKHLEGVLNHTQFEGTNNLTHQLEASINDTEHERTLALLQVESIYAVDRSEAEAALSLAMTNIAEAEKTKAALESAVANAIAEQKRLHE